MQRNTEIKVMLAVMLTATVFLAVGLYTELRAKPLTCAPTQLVETIIRNERPQMGDLERRFWLHAITKAAAEAGAPPVIFASQVAQESRFKGHVVSHKGAKGASQIMDVWLKEHKGVDLMEIEANLSLGAKILTQYISECGGIEGGLRCYAAGPKNQSGAQWYADRVLARVSLAATGACAVPGTAPALPSVGRKEAEVTKL